MKNLLFNLNSVEESYGDSILTSVIQVHERVDELASVLQESAPLNDFLVEEFTGRIEKLRELNRKIREELHQQEEKLRETQESVNRPSFTVS